MLARRDWKLLVAVAALIALAVGLAAYKLVALDYRLSDILPETKYRVTYELGARNPATR